MAILSDPIVLNSINKDRIHSFSLLHLLLLRLQLMILDHILIYLTAKHELIELASLYRNLHNIT